MGKKIYLGDEVRYIADMNNVVVHEKISLGINKILVQREKEGKYNCIYDVISQPFLHNAMMVGSWPAALSSARKQRTEFGFSSDLHPIFVMVFRKLIDAYLEF